MLRDLETPLFAEERKKDTNFEPYLFTYKYIVKLIYYLLIPLISFLLCLTAIQSNYSGVVAMTMILITNIIILLINREKNRKKISDDTERKITEMLFKVQIFIFGLFLLYSMVIESKWEVLPWTFIFCYLTILIIGIRGGVIIALGVSVTLLISYIFSSHPEYMATNQLVPRFFSSIFSGILFISFAEYVRFAYDLSLKK